MPRRARWSWALFKYLSASAGPFCFAGRPLLVRGKSVAPRHASNFERLYGVFARRGILTATSICLLRVSYGAILCKFKTTIICSAIVTLLAAGAVLEVAGGDELSVPFGTEHVVERSMLQHLEQPPLVTTGAGSQKHDGVITGIKPKSL